MSSLVILDRHHKNIHKLEQFIKPKAGTYQKLDLDAHPQYSLIIWTAEQDTTALYIPFDNGDFIAVCGTFFYGAQRGEEAAQKFHAAFDPDTFNWDQCSGQFTIAIGKNKQLFIFNDGLAAWKIYTNQKRSYISAGFLEALLLEDSLTFDPQGLYEYAFTGFSLAATTFIASIKAIMPNHLLVADGKGSFAETELPTPIKETKRPKGSFDDMVAYQLGVLETRFKKLSGLKPNEVISSASGGFDSRLMINQLTKVGIRPELFVYGPPGDPDIVPALELAKYFGLPITHIDKGALPPAAPEDLPTVEEAIFYCDGWKDDGLMGIDHDIADRKNRGAKASYMANGKCGEIYRQYYYQHIGKSGISLQKQVKATFGRVTKPVLPSAFDTHAYQEHVEQSFRALTGFSGNRMSQRDLEYLYPKVRICHDSGRDIAVNHRYSHALYPYVEPELCGPALTLNYEERLFGKAEANMIALSDPALIDIPSAYGYDLLAGPGLSYRAKMSLTYKRPMWLREAIPSLQNLLQRSGRGSIWYRPESRLIPDRSMPYMQKYFVLDNVTDSLVASRIYTLEMLAQYFNFA